MQTIKNVVKIEFEERKSKFIGYAKPIDTKIEAENFINMIKIYIVMLVIIVVFIKLLMMDRNILKLMMMENQMEQQENLWERC